MGELATRRVRRRTKKIDGRSRIALDFIRAFAACYVVIHHVVVNSTLSGPITYFFRFGQEAVIVFFLLSGFLIYASERNRVLADLSGYYLRRLRRIYPPLLVAMSLTGAVVAWNGAFAREFNYRQLLLNLVSLQDVSALKPGVIVDPFLGNSPLWSLSYEVFFYLLFPLIILMRRFVGKHLLSVVGTASLVGYGSFLWMPNHFSLVLSYLLVWWSGAKLADLYLAGELTLLSLMPLVGWLAGLCAFAAVGVALSGLSDPGVFPMLPLRHFGFALICVVTACTGLRRAVLRVSQFVAMPASVVASISYGLYLFHYPLLVQWAVARSPAGFVLAVAVLGVVSVFGDRVLDRVLPKPIRQKIAKN